MDLNKVLNKLIKYFDFELIDNLDNLNSEEERLAKRLKDFIKNYECYDIEEIAFIKEEDNDWNELNNQFNNLKIANKENDDYKEERKDYQFIFNKYSHEKMDKIYNFYETSTSNSRLKATCSKFKINYDSNKNDVYSIVKYMEEGNDFEKYVQIKEYVFSQFCDARDQGLMVKETDFHYWLKEANSIYQPIKNCLSKSFFDSFKNEYRISFRRINSFVQNTKFKSEDEIRENAAKFVKQINELIEEKCIDDSNIWNSDQSGFQKEMYSNRCYAYKSEKRVVGKVVSENSTTHSYSIQVNLNKDGCLAPKLYICLQEAITGNAFGPSVQREVNELVERFKNIFVECSKSGKLTKNHIKSWFDNTLGNGFSPTFNHLILLDAWGGHSDVNHLLEDYEENVKQLIEFQALPKSTTKYIQPLDVYFFRQYKIITRKIVDYLRNVYFRNDDINKPHSREYILKMHSLTYNQLCSKEFQPMLKYAWYKSGYGEMPDNYKFKNVNEILFNKKELTDCTNCKCISFINCAYCKKSFCFQCFFFNYHYHN